MDLTDFLDPAWIFATTVGEFAAAVGAAFVMGLAAAMLGRRKS